MIPLAIVPPLPTPQYRQIRFCPECGAELEHGKPQLSGYDVFTGEPRFYEPLVCPNSRRWRKRCTW